MTALPVSVFIAVLAMWWVWATYPNDQYFFLERILPFYSLYLTLTAICMKVVSGQIRQFLLITLILSSLFIIEIFLRVFLGFKII
ncbi:hypothetical protein N9Z27_02730 [Alphaproteobacteria bacterium]|nr:hypothetical protein [Alphaproteobacteria bacterium]